MANNIHDIRNLNTPLLLFGGVYSNLPALEALWRVAIDNGFSGDQLLCTGDVIGYCAEPDACVRFMAERGIRSIAGNVEIQLRNGEEVCGCDFASGTRCDIFSRQWYPYARQHVSAVSMEWLDALPEFIDFNQAGRSYRIVHGSQRATAEYIYASTPTSVFERELDQVPGDIIAGHGGLPFTKQLGERRWLNPGVIGMPANDGTSRVWYGILKNGEFSLHTLDYDHRKAADRMRRAGLPESYARTLETGLWDNCDVLPPAETAVQGIGLSADALASAGRLAT